MSSQRHLLHAISVRDSKIFPVEKKNMNIWTYDELQNTRVHEFDRTLFQSTAYVKTYFFPDFIDSFFI